MLSGEKILQVFNFYIQQLIKVFNVLDSLELFPGISYLTMLIIIAIISILFRIITFGLKSRSLINEFINNDSYVGKHSEEYTSKHSKTGISLRKKRG